MTTQEIQNIKLDDYQVSKMMLGNYQVWPFNEIDYGPEVPEIEGDYLAFATYGEADISFTTWGITYTQANISPVWIDGVNLGDCIVNFQPDVIYSFDGQIWNDLSWQEKEDKTGYDFETIHITQEKPVYIKRKDPSIPIHYWLQLILWNYYGFNENYYCPFSFTMSGDEVYCSGKLKAWFNPTEYKKNRLERFQSGISNLAVEPCIYGLFMGCKTLKVANIDFDEVINGGVVLGMSWMFSGCSSLIVGPKLNITNVWEEYFINAFQDCSSLIKIDCNINISSNPGNAAFAEMFKGCSSLIVGPKNIVVDYENTTTKYIYENAFNKMFEGCKSLINAPCIVFKSNKGFESMKGNKFFVDFLSGCDCITHININIPENGEIDGWLISDILVGLQNLKYIKFGKVTSDNVLVYWECFRRMTISNYSENGLLEIDKDSYSDAEKELFKIPTAGYSYTPPQGWKIVRV